LLGAAEYRVVKSDPAKADDGELLDLANPVNAPVSIAIPLYSAPTSGSGLAYSYDPASQAWTAPSGATPGAVATYTYTSSDFSNEQLTIPYVMVTVPRLSWWGVSNGSAPATCVTGTVQSGGPAGSLLVRAAGVSYLGTSTGLSGSDGTFCIDVAAAGLDGNPAQVQLYAEAVASHVPYGATQTVVISTSTGSCEAGVTGCTALSVPITLAPVAACVSGAVEYDDGGPTALNTFLVNLDSFGISQGLQTTAYFGQTAIGANGSFCALAPPGAEIQLVQPSNVNCWAPDDDALSVPSGTSGSVCGGAGCIDAGALPFACTGR